MFAIKQITEKQDKPEKEAIHSGHFMISHFEAEEQDDEDELAIPLPEVVENKSAIEVIPSKPFISGTFSFRNCRNTQQLAIETNLSKLFQCMSLAYRQKLTSPKWNRFRGIRLRWKDKIRLNNVIWRCWHMQFIKNQNTLICQFASPLDVNTHNKPEAVVLEGKYWKRKLEAVTAEYKKWRMFYRNQTLVHALKDPAEAFSEMDMVTWNSQCSDDTHMLVDEDYMGLMSDTLFSAITSQPIFFPDSREIAKAGLADFIQPSLGSLQPNLDDYMDTFEPLQEFISGKLPTVPEEHGNDAMYKQQQQLGWCYSELDLMNTNSNIPVQTIQNSNTLLDPYQSVALEKPVQIQDTRQTLQPPPAYGGDMLIQQPVETFVPRPPPQQPPPPYQSSVISKISKSPTHVKVNSSNMYNKSVDVYQNYSTVPNITNNLLNNTLEDPLTIAEQQTAQAQEMQRFKLASPTDQTMPSQGFKFSAPPNVPPNIKFSSQVYNTYNNRHMMPPMTPHIDNISSVFALQKEDKRGHRGRQRSRSTTREPLKRPPLLSAVSDPQLVTPSNSALLTQLLTNNSDARSIFTTNQTVGVVRDCTNSVQIKEEITPIPILPQPTVTPATLIITTTTPITMNPPVQPVVNEPLLQNTMRTTSSPILDNNSQSLNSPTSSQGSIGSPNRDTPHKEKSRVGHIHAEQKRRYNIKNGFDMIHSLIPHLNQNPNAKLSKAAMLQKGAEYIRQLRSERNQLKEEMDSLRQQIENLNTSISNCQSLLPATGAPVSRRRDSKMQEMFDDYVKTRTMENWKFWIFSLLFRPLLISFNNFVSTSSLDDLYRSTLLWIEQHCTLVDLRPVVLNSLRYLCTKTDILSEPEKLPEEARQEVSSSSNKTHH